MLREFQESSSKILDIESGVDLSSYALQEIKVS